MDKISKSLGRSGSKFNYIILPSWTDRLLESEAKRAMVDESKHVKPRNHVQINVNNYP